MVPPTITWAFFYQSSIMIILHRHVHRPTWTRQFLISTLFPDDSRLCQVDRNKSSYLPKHPFQTLLAVSWVFVVVCFLCVDMCAYQETYVQKSNWKKGNLLLELGILAGKNRYLVWVSTNSPSYWFSVFTSSQSVTLDNSLISLYINLLRCIMEILIVLFIQGYKY